MPSASPQIHPRPTKHLTPCSPTCTLRDAFCGEKQPARCNAKRAVVCVGFTVESPSRANATLTLVAHTSERASCRNGVCPIGYLGLACLYREEVPNVGFPTQLTDDVRETHMYMKKLAEGGARRTISYVPGGWRLVSFPRKVACAR